MPLIRPVVAAFSFALASCYAGVAGDGSPAGSGAEPTDPPGSDPSDPDDDPADDPEAEACEPIGARLRRLSPAQFDGVMRSILPELQGAPSDGFVGTLEDAARFEGAANDLGMSTPHVGELLSTMEGLSAQIVTSMPNWVPCDPAEQACGAAVVEATLTRLFRRPPDAAELDRFETFLAEQREAFGVEAALNQLATAALLSPASLYRTEVGDETGVMTDYELASAISFALTDAPPDQELMLAAAGGELRSSDVRRAHALRLLSSPQTSPGLLRFMREYVHADRVYLTPLDPSLFPEFDRDLQELFYDEYEMFIDHVLWEDGGTFADLMTAPYTFANRDLAEHYGLDAASTDEFTQVASPDRMGLLTQGVYLVQLANDKGTGTSIVRRGVTVREEFLCAEPLNPPPSVNDDLPEEIEGPSTQRQRLEEHSTGACAGCHSQIDPFGYPFELYDPLGRPRTTEQGVPIDPSGDLPIDGERIHVRSVPELATALSESPSAQACFEGYLLLFVDGIDRAASCLETSSEVPVREALADYIASNIFSERTQP